MVKLCIKPKKEQRDFKWPIDYLYGFIAIIYFLVFVSVVYLYRHTELVRMHMYAFSWEFIKVVVSCEFFLLIIGVIFLYSIIFTKVQVNSYIKKSFFYLVLIAGILLFVFSIIDIFYSYLWGNLNLVRFLFSLPFAFWGIISIYLFRNRQCFV